MREMMLKVEAEEAYKKLRILLPKKECTLIAEEPPRIIIAIQGSLWGMSPRTAKKQLRFQVSPKTLETQISATSKLSSDYVKFAAAGCVFAIALIILLAWINIDIRVFAETQTQTTWNWLVQKGTFPNPQGVQLLTRLTQTFEIFLSIVTALETIVVAYIRFKIDYFAEDILETLRQF